jgi:hypothetical protein
VEFSNVSTTYLSSGLFDDFLVSFFVEPTDLRWPGRNFSFGSRSRESYGSRRGSREIKSSEVDLNDWDCGKFAVQGEG